jgi:membrane-associated phospholipid phosphatase
VVGGLVALFAVLAALVAAGAFTSIDQFAVTHLMPPISHGTQSAVSVSGLYDPFESRTPWWTLILDVLTYPCSVLVSGLVVALVVVLALRRGAAAPAVAVAVAWLAGNAIELLGKETLRRPALYALSPRGVRFHVVAFDNSFPSGHMIRGIVVVAAILVVAARWRVPLIVWVALVGPALVLAGDHTPSDVVAAAVIGLALVGGARLLVGARWVDARPRLASVLAGGRRRGATAP